MNGQPPWMENCSSSPAQRQKLLSDPSVFDSEEEESSLFYRQARVNGEPTGNGQLAPSGEDMDPETRSILHYELGYEKTHSCFRGSLTFALRYDFIHRVLMVHVIRANQLQSKNRNSGSFDPYVKMYLLPERRTHCKTGLKKTQNPEVNEMFSFDALYNTLASRMLQFTVYGYDRFARHDLIGNVIMRDLFEKSDLYTWTEYTMHIIGSNEKDDFGDLLMYITYWPNESKLSITVAKAYNLRPMDVTGASDPYVKIEQMHCMRRVRKKKTTKKRANLNPVWNETLTLELPEDQFDDTSLLITVMDWDRIGHNDLLGCCILGLNSPTMAGKEQWCDAGCRARPGSPRRLSPSHRPQSPTPSILPRKTPRTVGRWHSLLAEIPEEYKTASRTRKKLNIKTTL